MTNRSLLFCSRADNAVAVYEVSKSSCTLLKKTILPAHVVAMDCMANKLLCGQADGTVRVMKKVCHSCVELHRDKLTMRALQARHLAHSAGELGDCS
jgi:hypothetical protein